MTVMLCGMRLELDPLFTIICWLPIPVLWKAAQLPSKFIEYGKQAFKFHKAHVDATTDSEDTSFFSKFFSDKNELDIPEIALNEEAMSFIIAGTDTTATSLTYLFYHLLLPENKKFKEALLNEISIVPIDATATQLFQLKYLKAVIDESLRLTGGVLGSLPRSVPAGGAKFGGHALPGGITISAQAYTLHRDPEVFPEPER